MDLEDDGQDHEEEHKRAKKRRKVPESLKVLAPTLPATLDDSPVRINRSPVMILWGAIVGECRGFEWSEALSISSAVASILARAKGQRLGIYPSDQMKPRPSLRVGEAEDGQSPPIISLFGVDVRAMRTPDGLRALDNSKPAQPRYIYDRLKRAFGTRLGDVYGALRRLASAMSVSSLEGREPFGMYENFRPAVPAGKAGWGAAGELQIGFINQMAVELEKRKQEEEMGAIRDKVGGVVAAHQTGLTLEEIAQKVSLDTESTARYLSDLQLVGKVYQNQDKFLSL